MTFKAKFISVLTIGLLAAGVILFETAQPTMATPDKGSDCTQCHSAMPPTKANVKGATPAPATKPTTQPATTKPTTTKPSTSTSTSKTVPNYTGKNVTVTASALNVRASGSASAKIVNVVKKGTTLSVLKQASGWLQVKYSAGTGWVDGHYVTLAATQPKPTTPATTTPPVVPTPPTVPVTPPRPALVTVPSINDQVQNSRLGSMHWNFFGENVTNAADPEQNNCISCHSAVKIVDDPNAKLTDFLKKGQKYASGENADGTFNYATATEDGKYVGNNFEGITCRVCHTLDKNGLTLSRPDNTCTLCHGRTFNWSTGSGHHIEQDFYAGHGETSYDPSVHYTLDMQCQDCHTMNAVKHDYEPAAPADIVKNAKCQACHQNAKQLQSIIDKTQKTVEDSLTKLNNRLAAFADSKDPLVAKAKARVAFITGDYSNGVHNPQFAGKLINEANGYLDQLTKSSTAKVDLGNLMVYSQAQSSELGNRHWDKLEVGISFEGDPSQNSCISCHSAVRIVDDPNSKITDFLKAGEKYASGENEDGTFNYSTATEDGKYLKNYKEGITCRVCHSFNQPGNIGLLRSEEQTCGLCHGRTFNWDTGSGHHVELAFFKGQGSTTQAIPDTPSFKADMGFNCQDCHFMDSSKHDFQPATPAQIAANKKCNSCHTASNVAGYIDGIQKEVKAGIANLQPRLDAAKAYVDKNPTNAAAKATYTQAKAGVTFIEDDFSDGVHNPAFARYLLDRSGKLLTDFEAKYK